MSLLNVKKIFTHVKYIILDDESIKKSANAISLNCSWAEEDDIIFTVRAGNRPIRIAKYESLLGCLRINLAN